MRFRRKKSQRYRGSHTHGWGSKKKHRHAGHRGGRGNAGSGKRGDAKKPSYWKERYFGKFGFVKHGFTQEINAINIKDVERMLKHFIAGGFASEKAGVYTVDLNKAGYNKLLATGKATKKLNITVDYASQSAVEKIKGAGGDIKLKVALVKPKVEKAAE
jgi:large subunit ribosomal protein L15